MRQRVKMTVMLAVVLALVIGVAPVFGAGQVTELLGKVQDDKNNLGLDSVQWTEVTEALVALGPAAVQELAGMVMDPVERGKKNASDLKARNALHAIALHVTRPGAEAERAGFGRAVAAQLAAQHPPAVKGFLIRQLRFAGGPETVQALGEFLTDELLCEYAAQTLVSIRVGAAEQFRQALKTAKGPAKVTIIQGLGVLRDREAVSDLLRATADQDAQLRLTALSALGNIGDVRAAEPLKKAAAAEGLYERAQATDALLLLATRLTESGRKADAADIYGDLWKTRTEPGDRHFRCVALLGLAVTTGGKAVPLLQEAMKSKDPEIRAAAVDAAGREHAES
jgi:hypothetical protein